MKITIMKTLFQLFFLTSVVLFLNSCGEKRTNYYSDGSIKEVGKVYQDSDDNFYKSGEWKYYYNTGDEKRGNVEKKGSYKKGKENGEWSYWYENGQLEYKREYKNGLKNGKLIEWGSDGKKRKECYYSKDTLNGVYKSWDYEGNNDITTNYKMGQYHGEFINYEKDRSYIKENYLNGKKDGSFVKVNKNGKTLEKGKYIDGKKDGKWQGWYGNGQKEYVRKYSSKYEWDNIIGKDTAWHKDGKIKHLKNFVDNEGKHTSLDGNYIEYHSNGKTAVKALYEKGGYHNRTEWWSNGNKRYEGYNKFNGKYSNSTWYNQKGSSTASVSNGNGHMSRIVNGNFEKEDTRDRKYTCFSCEIEYYYPVRNGKKKYKEYTIYTNGTKRYKTYDDGQTGSLYNPGNYSNR